MEHGDLPGDVAALFLVAAVLGFLTPRGVTGRARQAAAERSIHALARKR